MQHVREPLCSVGAEAFSTTERHPAGPLGPHPAPHPHVPVPSHLPPPGAARGGAGHTCDPEHCGMQAAARRRRQCIAASRGPRRTCSCAARDRSAAKTGQIPSPTSCPLHMRRAPLSRETAVTRAGAPTRLPLASPPPSAHALPAARSAADRMSRDVSDATETRAVAKAAADAESSPLLLPGQTCRPSTKNAKKERKKVHSNRQRRGKKPRNVRRGEVGFEPRTFG